MLRDCRKERVSEEEYKIGRKRYRELCEGKKRKKIRDGRKK